MKIVSVKDLVICIHQARKDRDWTQAKLAEQAGVSRDWIIGLEKAKPTLELGLVLRTLKALNLPLSIDQHQKSTETFEGINLDEVLNPHPRDVPGP